MATKRKTVQAPELSSLPALSLAVKTVRTRYADSQEAFAQRLSISNMTVSKFERGVTIPRDPTVLQKLAAAAEDKDLRYEADQFMAAYKEALGVAAVNRMYPGPLISIAQPGLSVAFQTLPEWRLLMIALFAAQYDSETAQAIDAAGGPVRAIVDEALTNADASAGYGPDFFRELEGRIRARMNTRSVKRNPRTLQDQEGL